MRWLIPLAAMSLIFVATVPSAAEAAVHKYQRMVIAPGIYGLRPGGSSDAEAFCLDEALAAPIPGVALSRVEAEALDATVTVADASPITLQSAIDRHIIAVEGLGGLDFAHIRLKNLLPDRAVKVEVKAASVLAENDDYPMADARKFTPALRDIVRPQLARREEEADEHKVVQQRVWTAFNAQTDAAFAEADWLITAGPMPPRTAWRSTDLDRCPRSSTVIVLCYEDKR
ncbi:MAG TPA: hypothetical protein VNT30_20190 [Stellaceae bacterium]|nr:hypothetical protein [Stellaceae bacterium]